MEATNIIEEFWVVVQQFVAYAQFCVASDIKAVICRDFWVWNIVAMFAIAILIALFMAKTIIRDKLLIYRHRKWLAERAVVADADTIDRHKWVGDDAVDVSLSQEDLAAEIRKATRANKSPSGENA